MPWSISTSKGELLAWKQAKRRGTRKKRPAEKLWAALQAAGLRARLMIVAQHPNSHPQPASPPSLRSPRGRRGLFSPCGDRASKAWLRQSGMPPDKPRLAEAHRSSAQP
jgi:hypothetical protein